MWTNGTGNYCEKIQLNLREEIKAREIYGYVWLLWQFKAGLEVDIGLAEMENIANIIIY